ncbi:MAG: IS6 family transposase [Chloroflexi bacterium]|nr:IS6 family transposase [Chloroflexota bacterium]
MTQRKIKVILGIHDVKITQEETHDDCIAPLAEVSYTQTITITCKHCGSKNVVKYGKKGDIQYYLCRDCGRTFAGNNALPGMKYPPDQIACAVRLFYKGLSLEKIRRELDSLYHVRPSDSTVYEWVVRFTKVAVQEAKFSSLKVGSEWVADETVLQLDRGVNVWFWDIIDEDTRFLLASHLSLTRTTKDAQALMEKALERAGKTPRVIYTDKLASYLDGIELTFGADTKHRQGGPFDIENNTNKIERFHGTLKSRTEIMRGMHNPTTATLIMDGWLINYNFMRPHEALKDLPPKGIEKTPAEVAKATYPYKSWEDVVMGGAVRR